MPPNFTECAIRFGNLAGDAAANFSYTGPVFGVLNSPTRPSLITYEGCRQLCGSGNQYYSWTEITGTISTWVLPIIGLLLQAPFESNAFRRTVLAFFRWIGSPIASLSYTLWNIKVTGKSALMVDMATKYDDIPLEDSEFGKIRDSFYILSVMNQYTVQTRIPGIEAEKFLRIILFSDTLQLGDVDEAGQSLAQRRKKLAQSIRDRRRRGVVPVFFSLMWFLFSLGISVEAGMQNTPFLGRRTLTTHL